MQFFQWLATNWKAVGGWSTGLYIAYHIGRFFTYLILKIRDVVTRFVNAEGTLSLMATNHLPHIQKELEKTTQVVQQGNEILLDIHGDLRKVLKIEGYE